MKVERLPLTGGLLNGDAKGKMKLMSRRLGERRKTSKLEKREEATKVKPIKRSSKPERKSRSFKESKLIS